MSYSQGWKTHHPIMFGYPLHTIWKRKLLGTDWMHLVQDSGLTRGRFSCCGVKFDINLVDENFGDVHFFSS
jgi:hypothetical protein